MKAKRHRQRGKTDMEMPRAERAGLKLKTSWTELAWLTFNLEISYESTD
ncbi:hypothetical protein ES703_100851 [subsurface metagenome]